MSKTFKRMCIILAAVMTVMMMFTVCSFADDEDGYVKLKVGDTKIVSYVLSDDGDKTVVNTDLPKGIAYDDSTHTLTLTDCNINYAGAESENAYIYSNMGDELNIIIKGNNIFKGSTKGFFSGISANEDLIIKGDGKLTMDLSENKGAVMGICPYGSLTIDGPSIDIIGGSTPRDSCYFYGITFEPWTMCSMNPEPEEPYGISISNANINISSTVSGSAYNVGIDSQDSDLAIENSRIQIDLKGGEEIFGLGCGLYGPVQEYERYQDSDEYDEESEPEVIKYGPVFGGKLTIDDKTWMTIKCSKLIEDDDILSMYYYSGSIGSKCIYVGDEGTSATLTDLSVMKQNQMDEEDSTLRYENEHGFVEFAPEEKTHDNPVIPKREEQQDSDSGDGQQGGGSGSGDGQQDGSGSGEGQQGGGDGNNGGSNNDQPSGTPSGNDPAGENGKGAGNADTDKYYGMAEVIHKSVVYNGKYQRNIKAYDYNTKKELVKGVDYDIRWYSNPIGIGTHDCMVVFMGKYVNTPPIPLSFKILPAKTKVKSVKKSKYYKKNSIVYIKKLKGGVSYALAYRKKGSKTWKHKKVKKYYMEEEPKLKNGRIVIHYNNDVATSTIKNLKKNKKYQFKVRAFKKVKGKTYYGKWSKTKTVKIK